MWLRGGTCSYESLPETACTWCLLLRLCVRNVCEFRTSVFHARHHGTTYSCSCLCGTLHHVLLLHAFCSSPTSATWQLVVILRQQQFHWSDSGSGGGHTVPACAAWPCTGVVFEEEEEAPG
eukprot:jgi/Mesen1/7129/ME000369S06447